MRTAGCPGHWLIIDSRPSGRFGGSQVDAGDAEAFLRLRPQMDAVGVTLLDAMVFDDQCHWWSLHELSSGSTTWAPPPLRRAS